jgi:hypothetical protein
MSPGEGPDPGSCGPIARDFGPALRYSSDLADVLVRTAGSPERDGIAAADRAARDHVRVHTHVDVVVLGGRTQDAGVLG